MEIVINKCYGGFSLSKEACELLIKQGIDFGLEYGFLPGDVERTDTRLIEVVKTLGPKRASGEFAELAIIKIPDGIEYEIEEYDGIEWVAESHKTWH